MSTHKYPLRLLRLLAITVSLLGSAVAAPIAWTVTSPNGSLSLTIEQAQPGGPLSYRVDLGAGASQRTLLAPAPLGLRRTDENFIAGLVAGAPSRREVTDTYELPRGKQRKLSARGHELILPLVTHNGHRLEIVARAYDDGVAFRYRFPERNDHLVFMLAEETGFQLPPAARAWMMPHDDPTIWTPSYEAAFLDDIAAGTASPKAAGWGFPALFKVPQAGGQEDWLLITEADLDRNYCGTRLAQNTVDGQYRMRLPDAGEGMGLGGVEPASTLPWQTPWRVVIASDSLAGIVQSNLVTHLAAPTKLEDTRWIKAGRASWSWWSNDTGGYDRLRSFLDLAIEMGWEYSLLDAGWDKLTDDELRKLVAHARANQVSLLVWYDSGVRDKDRTGPEASKMFERTTRRAEFKRLVEFGLAGIKVDFFHSDKQLTIGHYIDLLEDAAEFRLLVNFHGATLPRGWERTYPHLLAVEAVLGAEAYRFSEAYAAVAPVHNTILPFTRNVVGPMDYTPVTFTNHKYPRRTSAGHELALAVVYESGLLHFADAVEAYRRLPAGARDFLRAVPAAWDETRLVAGYPGKLAVLARRSGSAWFVGGITSENMPQSLVVPLAFLPAGEYAVTLTTDSAGDALTTTTLTARSGMDLSISLQARGGFVMQIVPQK